MINTIDYGEAGEFAFRAGLPRKVVSAAVLLLFTLVNFALLSGALSSIRKVTHIRA